MKKLLTVVFAMLIAASLSFAQDTGDKGGKKDEKTATDKKDEKGGKKAKKDKDKKDEKGKKDDKGADTTAPPK